MYGAHIRVLTL